MTAATPRRRRFHSDSLGELSDEVMNDGVVVDVASVVQLDDGTHLESWTTTHEDPQRLIETVSDFRQRVRERLTPRQRTVLQMAYSGGDYEQPRRRTGEELAGRLDITGQAFHDHLPKAHVTVFEALIEDSVAFSEVDK